MKDFIKTVGASLVALIIFTVIAGAITLMSIVGMVAASSTTISVDKNSVLVLKLDGDMSDQVDDTNIRAQLQGVSGLGLTETLSAIKKAKDNDNIKGIYIETGDLGIDVAQAQEIRDALEDFKTSKKWIIAYGELYGIMDYYIASVADKVYMNTQGLVDWHGLGGEIPYYKNAFAKIGVKFTVLKYGKYKSAGERFTEEKMSAADREQTERYMFGWWQTICQAVSKSRGISIPQLNAYADRLITFDNPQNFRKCKFVDGLCYNDEIKDIVKKQMGLGEDDELHQLTVADMQDVKEKKDGDQIAVYYASGEIVDEQTPLAAFQGRQIVVKDMCDELQKLADDDDVKAVVLRVNSPGGSAYGSEQIWHEIMKLRAKKPVVVSMGGYAASGGYYISAPANYIFAEPTTITGSIGIIGCFTDVSALRTKILGINYDYIYTNRNATMGSDGKPMTAEQLAIMQNHIANGYMLFKTRVSQGRKLSMDRVEEIAQGHVYLGSDALKIKLVDELGGIDQAVAKAAQLAKVKEYYAANYPGGESIFDELLNSQEGGPTSFLDEQMRQALGDLYEPVMMLRTTQYMNPIQARLPYIIKIK